MTEELDNIVGPKREDVLSSDGKRFICRFPSDPKIVKAIQEHVKSLTAEPVKTDEVILYGATPKHLGNYEG